MNAITTAIASFFANIVLWIARQWGYKVAFSVMLVGSFMTCYAAFLTGVVLLVNSFPSVPSMPSGLWAFLRQFFPSVGAIAFACTAYWGTMAVKKACTYWVKVLANVAKVAT